jgi:hypothetical protein
MRFEVNTGHSVSEDFTREMTKDFEDRIVCTIPFSVCLFGETQPKYNVLELLCLRRLLLYSIPLAMFSDTKGVYI